MRNSKGCLLNTTYPKDVYETFSEKMTLADIDPKYLDDLLLVTQYYESYRHDLRGDGKKHQEAASHMLGFVEELNNGLFEVDRLTIRGKRTKRLNPLKYELDQKFVINEPNILRNLIQEFKGWLNNPDEY